MTWIALWYCFDDISVSVGGIIPTLTSKVLISRITNQTGSSSDNSISYFCISIFLCCSILPAPLEESTHLWRLPWDLESQVAETPHCSQSVEAQGHSVGETAKTMKSYISQDDIA